MKLFFLSVMFLFVLQLAAFSQLKNQYTIPAVSNPVIQMENLKQQWNALHQSPHRRIAPHTLFGRVKRGPAILVETILGHQQAFTCQVHDMILALRSRMCQPKLTQFWFTLCEMRGGEWRLLAAKN